MQRRLLWMIFGLRDEHFGLVQRRTNKIGGHGRKYAKRKHAAPADHGQQQRRGNGSQQHAALPTQTNIGRGARTFRGRPGFSDQRHADPEFAAKADAGKGAVDQEIPIALRKRAKTGEHREHDNGPGQDAHAAEAIRKYAEADTAEHRADQRGCHQRGRLGLRQMEIACNRPQHKAENKKIESVHCVADRRTQQRLPRIAVDSRRNALHAVRRDAHFDTPPRLKSPTKSSVSQTLYQLQY